MAKIVSFEEARIKRVGVNPNPMPLLKRVVDLVHLTDPDLPKGAFYRFEGGESYSLGNLDGAWFGLSLYDSLYVDEGEVTIVERGYDVEMERELNSAPAQLAGQYVAATVFTEDNPALRYWKLMSAALSTQEGFVVYETHMAAGTKEDGSPGLAVELGGRVSDMNWTMCITTHEEAVEDGLEQA